MRTEVLGIVTLGLLTTACSSLDRHPAIGDQSRNALNEASSGQALGPSRLPSSEHLVRQAQSELKREGLYKAKVDGIAGPETKQALAAFRQREGLQQTASLDQATMQRIHLNALRMYGRPTDPLEGNATSEGSGSSMPPAPTPSDASPSAGNKQ
jgi:peptidoglycan hydrolase-like protein with peptidoglycan-binding domain